MNAPSDTQGLVAYVGEVWQFRDVVRAFAIRNVKVRYKETFLGFGWLVVQPLSTVVPFIIILGHLAKISGAGIPYAAFAISAVVFWQYALGSINNGVNALAGEAGIARKVYFPRLAPILGAMGAGLLDLLVGWVISLPLVWVFGGHLSWPVVLLPVALILGVPGILSITSMLAILNMHYRDVRYLLPVISQVLLYGSPVAYPLALVPRHFQLVIALVNPIAAPLDLLRHVVALGSLPDATITGLGLISGVIWSVIGLAVFRRLEQNFADLA